MAIAWDIDAQKARQAETDRKHREELENLRNAHNLSPNEAAWVQGRREHEAEQAREEQHRLEQEAFLKYANKQIDKPSQDPRNKAEWTRCLAEVCLGRWPESEMLRSSPEVALRFQGLRARLARENAAANPKPFKVANPFAAWR